MPSAGFNDALHHFPVALYRLILSNWRFVLTIPEPADDIWMLDIAHLKADQHLIIDLGQEHHTPIDTSPHRDHSCPIALDLIIQPGKLEFDPSQSIWIKIVGHNPDHQA